MVCSFCHRLYSCLRFRGQCIVSIFQYNKQDAKLHSLFISRNYSTCFGWYLHPSSGAHTTVSTGSGTCQTVTALPAAVVEESELQSLPSSGPSLLWLSHRTDCAIATSYASYVTVYCKHFN